MKREIWYSMQLNVQVKAGSRKESIEKTNETHWIIKVRAPAIDGRANEGVIQMIASALGIPKSKVRIIRGERSKFKTLDIAI